MKMQLNQQGMTAIEVAIFVIAMGFAGATGYYVYDKNKQKQSETTAPTQTQTPTEADTSLKAGSDDPETAAWTELISGQGGFAMRTPDGWKLENYLEIDDARSQDIVYNAGTKAIIDNIAGAGGGDSFYRFSVTQFKNTDNFKLLDGDETAEPFTAGTLNGVRYYKKYPVTAVDGIGPYPGTDSYTYIFKTDKTTTAVSYNIFNLNKYTKDYVTASDANQLSIVDKAVKTLRIKE
jgi:hypothetical protein